MKEENKTWPKVLDYIMKFKREQGRFPRQYEVTESFGWSGRENASRIYKLLVLKGHIEVDRGIITKLKRKENKVADKFFKKYDRDKREGRRANAKGHA
jgi:hypothetical protein